MLSVAYGPPTGPTAKWYTGLSGTSLDTSAACAKSGLSSLIEVSSAVISGVVADCIVQPEGVREKSRLTYHFVRRAAAEYNRVYSRVIDCLNHITAKGSREIVFYGTGDIAQDVETVRAALGYDKVDYFAASAGGQDVAAYAILVLVLIFRPSGLLGRPEIEKV